MADAHSPRRIAPLRTRRAGEELLIPTEGQNSCDTAGEKEHLYCGLFTVMRRGLVRFCSAVA